MRFVLVPFLLAATAACTTPAADSDFPIGVQLYTIREAMAADPHAALRRVARLGYREVEFAGVYGAEPQVLCAEVQSLGMAVAAVHADWETLRVDPAAAIGQAKDLCSDDLILAWLPEDQRQSLAQWGEWVARLNELAEEAASEGIRVGYHAHDFEFVPIDGVRPIDLLMDELDPRIGFELDTYWLARAGEEPRAFLARYADRITHLHLKDVAADGGMADVGEGILRMADSIAQARAQGVRHFLVERDDASDPWASLAASLDSVRAMPLQQDISANAFRSANP